jgi:hypothetical protein
MNETTHLRKGSRKRIFPLVRTLRGLQRINNYPDSQIFHTILNVWKLDGCSNFIKVRLEYMVEELRHNEKLERRIRKYFNREQ